MKTLTVQNYNDNIYPSDMMLFMYLVKRRTLKYWKKVMFCIFSRMMLNAYLPHKEDTSRKKKTCLQFKSSITEAREQEWLEEKSFILQHPGQAGDTTNSGDGLRKLSGCKEEVWLCLAGKVVKQ